MKVTVSRKAHFNAAHKLFRPDWSDAKNNEVFGKCANENYHGHNYELIVSLTGEINQETGYVYDLGKLKNIIISLLPELNDSWQTLGRQTFTNLLYRYCANRTRGF